MTVLLNVVTFIVAVLGTIVVAWQAYETHRTTDLSQQTLESNHSLAIDSARSRLDQDAPRIDVYVEHAPSMPGTPHPPGPGGGGRPAPRRRRGMAAFRPTPAGCCAFRPRSGRST